MKLCKDCKYFSGIYRECMHPSSFIKIVDYTNGKASYHPANFMRKRKDCGENAVFFEPKETLISKIKSLFKRS